MFDNNPLHRCFLNAGKEAGYKYIEDINQYDNEGFGPCPQTISNGYRASTSFSFLNPIKDRKNLTIATNSTTNKLLFEGTKCVGLEYLKGKEVIKAYADREVIVCGGAINSPQILQLSGIGKGDYIKKWGLKVVADLPGVGENLQDHLDVLSHYELSLIHI